MILFAFPPVALPTSGLRVGHSLPSQPSGTPSEFYEIISQGYAELRRESRQLYLICLSDKLT